MKKMILLALTLTLGVSNAYATGSFECRTTDKSIEIFGTMARVVGNPLISAVVIRNGLETSYTAEQAVGYWNLDGEQVRVALADEQYLQLDYLLEVERTDDENDPFAYGTLRVAGEQNSYDVYCIY